MRVGIWLGEIIKEDIGGAATFQSNLLHEMINNKYNHQFYFIIDYDGNHKKLIKTYDDSLNIINLKKTQNNSKVNFFNKKLQNKINLLNDELQKNKIDFCWIACPSYVDINCPYAFTVWDLAHRLHTYFPEVSLSGWKFDDREQFYQRMINKSSYVIIGNKEGAKQVNQFYNYPIERIKTIAMPTPNYVYELKSEDSFIEKNNLIAKQYLFYPAQFWPHKNHIAILNAFKILLQKNESFKNFKIVFTVSNKGNEEHIKEKTHEYGLEKFVKFLGFVKKEQVISLYQNAFALVYPSMFGPDNIHPLEAMALNCPVI
ncbi:MAG: glycosyltransferase, partial [Alphaproteobacteria bacterium]